MKRSCLILAILLSGSTGRAAVEIRVVYPQENQEIPYVDSTFIFGNVTAGSKLTIDGVPVPVHKDGGWLAFLDVMPGLFTFHIIASNKGDTAALDWPIVVGAMEEAESESSRWMPRSPYPNGKTLYFAGDILQFSFEAPPGGRGCFGLNDADSVEMYASPTERRDIAGSVFGRLMSVDSIRSGDVVYIGYYHLLPSDVGVHRICYEYYYDQQGTAGENRACTDTLITVLPEFPPLVGKLSGTSQIIRTGPGMGYKLLNQPPGIEARIIGARDNFYELRLAEGISGFVNIDSVQLLTAGTPVPHGRVGCITVDTAEGGVVIWAEAGGLFPFEISESLDPPALTVDLFGVTGDVDWIRYNTRDPFVKIVRWSQPQNGVFRLNVEIGKGVIWGYDAYYEGLKFILQVKKKPARRGMLSNPIKGLKVAIDPGHSHDPGAIGPTGLKEEDANLWIAHTLRQLLERKGASVLMTRYGHEDVPLHERPTVASKWGADILISIHNNALPDGINPFYNNGTSVYYYHPHSKHLAEDIREHLLHETGLRDQGLYYGNLALTRAGSMPAVLVECAFMMIPEQEAMLKTDRFRRKCARAIMDGIKDYVKSSGR